MFEVICDTVRRFPRTPPLMSPSTRRLGILTGGGDCPGLNAVLRAVAKTAILQYGIEVIGIEDGWTQKVVDGIKTTGKPVLMKIYREGMTRFVAISPRAA